MNEIRVFICGEPKAQPRPRAGKRGGRSVIYNPSTADSWKIQTKAAFIGYQNLKIEGPIECDIMFLMPRPKSLMTKKAPDGLVPHIKKPDKDNLEKAVLDCLSSPIRKKKGDGFIYVGGIGVWGDDAQVYTGKTSKHYTKKGAEPGAWVTIRYGE